MFRPMNHEHPNARCTLVHGERLESHEVIDRDDVYADTSGVWRRCGDSLHGQAAGVMYVVRPSGKRPTTSLTP